VAGRTEALCDGGADARASAGNNNERLHGIFLKYLELSLIWEAEVKNHSLST